MLSVLLGYLKLKYTILFQKLVQPHRLKSFTDLAIEGTMYQVNISKHSEKKWSQLFYFRITEIKIKLLPQMRWKPNTLQHTYTLYKIQGRLRHWLGYSNVNKLSNNMYMQMLSVLLGYLKLKYTILFQKLVQPHRLKSFTDLAIEGTMIESQNREWNLICNLSLYTHIPNIKSISQSIVKKSGRNCFISELRKLK
jgi:hypothetical protein